MLSAAVHTRYAALLATFLRQLPDPGLRVLLRRDADPFFRQCACSLWQASGETITPEHAVCFNSIYSTSDAPMPTLFWDLVHQVDQAVPPPVPSFFSRLCRYDQETGRRISPLFLRTVSQILPLFSDADRPTASQQAWIQTYLTRLAAQCGQEVPPPDPSLPLQQTPPATPATASPIQQKAPVPDPSPVQPDPEPTLEDLLGQLDSLCGLDRVKQEVHSLINLMKVRTLRQAADLPVPPLSLHMVFQGSPGTGKTTVARLLAKLYRAIGVLSQGQLVEVDRTGLVAGYVGQTALKTKTAVQSAIGGILFLDEAYSLTPDSPNDFGQEAIEVLLKEMEDHRDDLVVIVAGYTQPMNHFLHSNPGLESRFNKYLTFDDYNGEQLNEIFLSLCEKNGYTLTDAARQKAAQGFAFLFEHRDETFGNAREVRNCFERAVARQADRIAALSAPTKEDLMTLLPEDLNIASTKSH